MCSHINLTWIALHYKLKMQNKPVESLLDPKSSQKLGVEWAVLYTSFQIMEIYNFWEVYSLNKNVS